MYILWSQLLESFPVMDTKKNLNSSQIVIRLCNNKYFNIIDITAEHMMSNVLKFSDLLDKQL